MTIKDQNGNVIIRYENAGTTKAQRKMIVEAKAKREQTPAPQPCASIHCRHWGLASGVPCVIEAQREHQRHQMAVHAEQERTAKRAMQKTAEQRTRDLCAAAQVQIIEERNQAGRAIEMRAAIEDEFKDC